MMWSLIPAPAGLVIRRVPKDENGKVKPWQATAAPVVALGLREEEDGGIALFAFESSDFEVYSGVDSVEVSDLTTTAEAERLRREALPDE